MDDNDTPTPASALDRRAALKKAATAAGIVAWATPTVQALTPGVARAQTITNCNPSGNGFFVLLTTGGECTRWNATMDPDVATNCCSKHTYFGAASGVEVTCGAACPGETIGTVTSITATEHKACADPPPVYPQGFPDLTNCGTDTVTVKGSVTCPDGTMWNCTYIATYTCQLGEIDLGRGANDTLNCTPA